MSKLANLNDEDYLFGTLFVVSNKLDTLLDREMSAFDITSKQWFLSVVLETLFDSPPTLKTVAREMGSSYQNIKQVALKLEQKKLLQLKKDDKDGRATILELASDSGAFWKQMHEPSQRFKATLFEGISSDDLAASRRVLQQLWDNLNQMESNQSQIRAK